MKGVSGKRSKVQLGGRRGAQGRRLRTCIVTLSCSYPGMRAPLGVLHGECTWSRHHPAHLAAC